MALAKAHPLAATDIREQVEVRRQPWHRIGRCIHRSEEFMVRRSGDQTIFLHNPAARTDAETSWQPMSQFASSFAWHRLSEELLVIYLEATTPPWKRLLLWCAAQVHGVRR